MKSKRYLITFLRGKDSQSFEIRYLRKEKDGGTLSHMETRIFRNGGQFLQADGSPVGFCNVTQGNLLDEVQRQATETDSMWTITQGPDDPEWALPPGYKD